MKTLTKIPSLKIVADTQAADRLRELIKDADDGFRRVVKVGLYIEWIAANLPHGQLLPWIAEHCADVSPMTVHRWRTMAKNICDWAGLKFTNLVNLPMDGARLLECPASELPPQLAKARAKMEEVLDSARTPKQLFLDIGFKQGELGADGYPCAKRGRRKGEGGASREQRAAHKQKLHQMDLAARRVFITNLGEACDEAANAKGIGDPECAAEFDEAFPKIENLFRFMQSIRTARKA